MGLTAWSAPGRCGLLGNPTDIYGGMVLSCSLPLRNSCRLHTDGQAPDDLRLWQAATARFPAEPGVLPDWHSEVPRSRGLAGSTAMLAATLACLKPPEDLVQFAELVRDIERKEGGVICGYQDAYTVVLGGIRRLDFTGKHPSVDGGPLGKTEKLDLPLPFLLVGTDVKRLSGSVHGPIIDRWLAGEAAVVDAMKIIASLVDPGIEALRAGRLGEFGDLMALNQSLVASLGGSGDAIDQLIERCLDHGAIAAKLAGAGLGGTVIALTEEPEELERALRADGYTRFARPDGGPGLRPEPCTGG